MASSSGGVRIWKHVGRCQICGGDDKVLATKCGRCGKRVCEKPDCKKSILDARNCGLPERLLPA